jgi:mono/diheme cytochrome c family protein
MESMSRSTVLGSSPFASACIRSALRLSLLGAVLALAPLAAQAAGDAAKGKVLYDTNCLSCHGATGAGDGPVGAALPEPKPRNFQTGDFKFDVDKDGKPGSDADLEAVIKNGAAAYGGNPMMAPWPQLSDQDRADLVAYIRSLKK